MTRTERAVCSLACIAAMLLLWWSFAAPPGWALWVRIGAAVLIPAVFLGVLAAQIMRQTWREEAGMTREQILERRRAARERVEHDVAPLLTRPDLYFAPLRRLWDLRKQTDPPKQSSTDNATEGDER